MKLPEKIPKLYCVRANSGKWTEHFLKGGYVAIGWLRDNDLSELKDRQELQNLYAQYYPDDSPYGSGQQVGDIARFLFEMKPEDYVLTPASNTEYVYWGILADEPYFYAPDDNDGCPYPHRRKVNWNKDPIQRSQFSVPFQNSIRSSLTVFSVKEKNDFFETIGRTDLVTPTGKETSEEAVLKRILELDPKEFEILVTHLLTALGFESEHTGKVGDAEVDARGELDLFGLAKIKLFVQAKRYKLGARITARQVRSLRQSIPHGAQGAFITTADFQKEALKVAVESGFPRIGTINGSQLVDLLSEKWGDLELPEELETKLGLKHGLIVE